VEAAPEAVEAPAAVAVAETPEPPRVVTRTRRGASREVVHTGADAVLGAGQVDGLDPEADDEHIEHVPIKKKGPRKR
jgi:ribonuclease E